MSGMQNIVGVGAHAGWYLCLLLAGADYACCPAVRRLHQRWHGAVPRCGATVQCHDAVSRCSVISAHKVIEMIPQTKPCLEAMLC